MEWALDHGFALTKPELDVPASRRDSEVAIGAAVDIGNNSVHLLVALVGLGLVESLRDRSELLGLGETVDAHGLITAEARGHLVTALEIYIDAARHSGAERFTLVGTDPLRRASNAKDVQDMVAAATGVPLRILTEEQEALLTFIGVTRGRVPEGPLVVVDIGGGSTEVVRWSPGHPLRAESLPIGSSRLTSAVVESDPPTESELEEMFATAAVATRGLADEIAHEGGTSAEATAIFVGGTSTNVARLGRLSLTHLQADRKTLGSLTVAQVSSRYAVRPRRAKQLAAGVAIVHSLLTAFGVETAEVSDASLRDGAIIAAARFGDEWLESLGELVPS